jgi:branched-chain amino acid transport system substrate-binding protein
MHLKSTLGALAAALLVLPAASFAADATPLIIGAALAQTGPASSLADGEVKAINMYVKEVNAKGGIAGHPLKVTILDTATDPQKAVLNVRKLITETKVAAIVCCTTTPESMAILDTVQRAKVPNISLASAMTVTEPVADRYWIFKTPPTDTTMIGVEVKDMEKLGIKTVGYLGFDTSLGKVGFEELKKAVVPANITIVGDEQFSPTDTNVSAQATKLVNAKPDAIFINDNPPGANLAQKAVQAAGYKGTIYQSYGVTNATFLRLGGDSLNGTRISVPPVIVYDQLPPALPFKEVTETFAKNYMAANNGEKPSSFAGFAYDAIRVVSTAADRALTNDKVQPTDLDAFRAAIRDNIEHLDSFQSATGTYNFSAKDHVGIGPSSISMVTVENGGYQLAK